MVFRWWKLSIPSLCIVAGAVQTIYEPDESKDWLDSLKPSLRHRIISERALTLVAAEVADVMHVGKIMDFKQGKLQQYQSEHPYSVSGQVSHMFSDWRAKLSSRATVEEFVTLMRQADIDDNELKVVITKEYGDCDVRKPMFV